MRLNGESSQEVIRPDFNRVIMIDFQDSYQLQTAGKPSDQGL
jgi:hypothetical protein